MADIAGLWARLESWGSANAPKMLEDLNAGATDEQIAEVQDALGVELPAAFVESLKIHNGESDGWPFKVFGDMGAYLPCDQILENWKMYLQVCEQVGTEFSEEDREEQIRDGIIDVEGAISPVLFDRAWVPIMNCNGNVFWALDFAPAAGGVDGQVIEVDHEGCSWKVVANSFNEFFERYVGALEAGEFEVDYMGTVTREPADEEEDNRNRAAHEAFESALGIDDLKKLEPGSEAEIVGMRAGRTVGEDCAMYIRGGEVNLRGSLRGATHKQVLRVKIRVGKRRALGLLGPRHEIISWELVKAQNEGSQNDS